VAKETVDLVFDPIFGVRAKKKFVKDSEKLGDKAGDKAGEGFGKGFGDVASKALKGVLAGIAAAASAAFVLKGAAVASAEVEQITTRLKTLTGSADAAAIVLKDLRQFAAETPFQLTDIANAATKLVAFGVSASEVKDVIKEIGEVAAGTGSDIGELALIYGQVGAAGKLTGERLLQLQERSVPIGPALAKSMGVAEASIKDLVSQGKVTQDVFNKAFSSMSAAGGQFEGALKAQSQTVSGILSTLSDNFFDLSVSIGDTLKPAIINSSQQLIVAMQEMSKIVNSNGPSMIKFFTSMANVLVVTPTKFWANFFSGNASSSIQRIDESLKGVNTQIRLTIDELKRAENAPSFVKFFSKVVGGIQGAKDRLNELRLKQIELEGERKRLLNKGVSEDVIRKQLQEQADEKRALQEQARIQRAKDFALQSLGTLGLEKQVLLQQQADAQILIIQNAHGAEVISQMEAARRISKIREDLAVRSAALAKKSANDTKNATINMTGSITSGISSAIGSMAQALAAGENILSALGSSLLNIIADMAIQMGEFFIAAGIGKLALEALPGGAAIAAGIGLVAFGQLLKAFSGGGGSATGISSGGGGVGAASPVTDAAEAATEEPEERTTETGINVNIAGDFLDSAEGGLKIVEAINMAFETQGAVIRTNVA